MSIIMAVVRLSQLSLEVWGKKAVVDRMCLLPYSTKNRHRSLSLTRCCSVSSRQDVNHESDVQDLHRIWSFWDKKVVVKLTSDGDFSQLTV